MTTARDLIPEGASLEQLRSLAAGCQACDLHRNATQTVFGEGSTGATVMLVGEQPGDREDLEGEPFVGPAGALRDRALHEAGIDRRQAYVTNVVKHFKWRPAGKRRLHQKPGAEEIRSCRPWLEAEIGVVRPAVVVCLGAHRGPGAPRDELPGHPPARSVRGVGGRREDPCHGASVVDPAST